MKEVLFPAEASAQGREVLCERIRREARAAAQLDHPAAVSIYDVVEEGMATYLVMQYIPSRTLSEVIRREGPLTPQRTARIGLALLGALRAAHARGIIHRDVKPSNVLLGLEDEASVDRALLTDFGIASAPGDSSLTSTGLLIGSPGYIAPERARGDAPGPASDLWSLGATLFTAVEGHPPYDGADPMSTLTAVMVGDHAPYVRAGHLEPVLAGLLERDPGARITAAQAGIVLDEIATSPVSVVPPAPAAAIDPDASGHTVALPHGAGSSQSRMTGTDEAHPRIDPPLAPPPVGARQNAAAAAPDPRHPRMRRLAWAGVAVTVVLGLAVAFAILPLLGSTGGQSSAGTPAASPAPQADRPSLPPLPPEADMPGEQLRTTIDDLTALAERAPDATGPAADEVLASLRGVESLDQAPRRSAAVVANTSAGSAVAAGELDAGVGQRVQEVLDNVARPERLIDLAELVGVDPSAIGTGGPRVFELLAALDHQVPADQTAAKAADLLEIVTVDGKDSAPTGELSEAFRTAAVPTLRELADPGPYDALRDLLADVERDPSSIGPAGEQVLGSLRAVAELPVYPQGNEADELLELIRQDGQVTPEFRDTAVPVLEAMIR